ncbi:nidogen [Phymastichus coffea]|uniref:nidogen n=1 Tax=Phymastichus coffea TaxID=108790 RepID=UPI00273B4F46|nr:nidogen [Phymastichus coffea]
MQARDMIVAIVALLTVAAGPSSFVSALARTDLYPYGGPTVATLKANSDGSVQSEELQLKTPIKLFDHQYANIFINGNGVLSFLRPMSRFFNIPFPLDDPVIAPLYTHVDIRASGSIYYEETNASDVISRASNLVRSSFKNASNFVPTHIFIATWLDVGYFHEKKDKINSFQVAISSNGNESYAELLYPDNGIQWIQGESHPNGLPDAKAQAGIMGGAQLYALMGSGTDQIQNIDKWSNVQRPGQWIFHIGPITEGQNIKLPDNIDDNQVKNQSQTCKTGGSTYCHSKASCVDYEKGFCCACKPGYFGNGRSCQPDDIPLRAIGKISGKINDVEFMDRDLQCYVQTKDGRTYMALARIPESIGTRFQLLNPMSGVIGWLFAKSSGDLKNGYKLTGGVFNHTMELIFKSTGDKLTIRNKYLGLDVFGQLKLESEIMGYLPWVEEGARVDYGDYEQLLTRAQPGVIRSNTERSYSFATSPSIKYSFTEDQTIVYEECSYAPLSADTEVTSKLKFSRGITTYESRENIVRFAVNSKIVPLEEQDPCIQGRATCGYHSSCIIDVNTFRCVCDPGYQTLYHEDGSSSCVDINECTVGNHACSSDAHCVNTEGSHVCQCKPGFSGDGRTCDKILSCEDTRCGDYEHCVETNGVPVCICMQGFDKTENGCYPSKRLPCNQASDCSPLATCDYSEEHQAYICTCIPGYLGSGYDCTSGSDLAGLENPVPQCQVEMCWCPEGWSFRNSICIRSNESFSDHGSGEIIRDHECHDDGECDQNEHCGYAPTRSRYECACQPGYSPLDNQCVLTDCSANPSQCHMNARCLSDGLGGYHCSCLPGYRGDGLRQCVEEHVDCNDVNTCARNAVCGYNQTSASYACVCLPGYHGDGYRCTQRLSCRQNPTLCSRDASCLPLTVDKFSCVCKHGFVGDGIDCHPRPDHESNFLLVNQGMATHKLPFSPSSDQPGNPIHLTNFRMAIAVDIDCSRGIVYTSDITGNKITSMAYNGSKSELFLGQVSSSEGIAVDWVSRVIFWTDSGNATIEVAHLDTRKRKVLIADGLVNPRGIAVHPYKGKIFWSDWNRASPKLEWANEDGTGRKIYLKGDNVQLPNSLAIDWQSDELCWADAGTFSINCANIDNKSVRVIAKNLTHPFGLAISRNHYYWTDWKTGRIEVAIKNTGHRGSSISLPPGGSNKPYGIVAVADTCPGVSNICQYENGRCTNEQLCLPDGLGGRTCACADNSIGSCIDSHYAK